MADVSEAILSVQDVSKSFGAQPVLEHVSLTIHDGDRLGLIGRNGTGKSTLLRIIADLDSPSEGFTTRKQRLRVVLLEQQSRLDLTLTVAEVLESATRTVRERLDRYHRVMDRLAEVPGQGPEHAKLAAEAAGLEHELHLSGAWDLDHEIKRATVGLDLPPADRVVGTLSGGEVRRLNLAVAVLRRPDLLLLDEPTNHIDVSSVQWIEAFIASYSGACVLVTHDRYFLDRVVNRIVEIERCRLTSYPGTYGEFLRFKTARDGAEAKADASRRAVMRRELAWLRRGPKARTGKQKARINRYSTLEDQAAEPRDPREMSPFTIPNPERLSKRILEVDQISKGYGDTPLFRDLTLIMQKHMRVGVVGPNGCGKTTLLRVLMGEEEPDNGTVFIGESTRFLYVDQQHEEVDPETSVLQHVSGGTRDLDVDGQRVYVPAYLERFLFDMRSIEMPMQNLSGGERNRIDIAKKLLRGGNFLVLDEPTNDLDLSTLRTIEEAVLDFDGCALIVSHDRYFLNRLCTHMLVFEEDGRVVQIAGNYDDYLRYAAEREADRAKEREDAAGVAAKRPARKRAQAARRLTWHEKRELEGIEDAIHAAEAEVEALEARIAMPGFYQGDHVAVQKTLAQHEQAKARVEQLYERWAQLEAIGNGQAADAG